VIPHITDEIKHLIIAGAGKADVAMDEIGGTVGDIESLPFLEAIRQMAVEIGRENTVFMHLTLVPYITTAGEVKTKPTQHSVKELRSIGIQPDILLCRAADPLPADERRKIALFTNVSENAVISAFDSDCIYDIPRIYQDQKLDEIVVRHFGFNAPVADLNDWERVVDAIRNPERELVIGMVGKYTELTESYKSLNEALTHAGVQHRARVNIRYIDSEQMCSNAAEFISDVDAVLVPGGFGHRGIEGKIAAVRYARENNIPYLGICLGLQVAVIEFARHCVGIEKANSTEFDADTPDPLIALVTEWKTGKGAIEQRDTSSNFGGTMRLGGQECALLPGSRAAGVYAANAIVERHRHRYEVNNHYVERLREKGMVFSGHSIDEDALVEIIELPDHPWFIGCQFHPEYTSTPRDGHPLFTGFIGAAIDYSNARSESAAQIAAG